MGLAALLAGLGVYLLVPSDEDEAVDRCQAAVLERLQAPSTAEWVDDSLSVAVQEGEFGSYFDVSGKIDAENGFGAKVRGDYSCKLVLDDGGWTVQGVDVAR